jgi:hypothetical protein
MHFGDVTKSNLPEQPIAGMLKGFTTTTRQSDGALQSLGLRVDHCQPNLMSFPLNMDSGTSRTIKLHTQHSYAQYEKVCPNSIIQIENLPRFALFIDGILQLNPKS